VLSTKNTGHGLRLGKFLSLGLLRGGEGRTLWARKPSGGLRVVPVYLSQSWKSKRKKTLAETKTEAGDRARVGYRRRSKEKKEKSPPKGKPRQEKVARQEREGRRGRHKDFRADERRRNFLGRRRALHIVGDGRETTAPLELPSSDSNL